MSSKAHLLAGNPSKPKPASPKKLRPGLGGLFEAFRFNGLLPPLTCFAGLRTTAKSWSVQASVPPATARIEQGRLGGSRPKEQHCQECPLLLETAGFEPDHRFSDIGDCQSGLARRACHGWVVVCQVRCSYRLKATRDIADIRPILSALRLRLSARPCLTRVYQAMTKKKIWSGKSKFLKAIAQRKDGLSSLLPTLALA
jgi:hypothetical protein